MALGELPPCILRGVINRLLNLTCKPNPQEQLWLTIELYSDAKENRGASSTSCQFARFPMYLLALTVLCTCVCFFRLV